MARIFITGDCHASYTKLGLKSFPESRNLTKDDYVIICGDSSLPLPESVSSPSEERGGGLHFGVQPTANIRTDEGHYHKNIPFEDIREMDEE